MSVDFKYLPEFERRAKILAKKYKSFIKDYDEDEKGIVLCVFASRFRWDDVFLFRHQDRCEEVGR